MNIDTATLLSAILFILNGALGVIVFLLKNAFQDMKEHGKETRHALEILKDQAYKKEDFKEFKEELWRRFDKLEIEVNQKIQEVKHG